MTDEERLSELQALAGVSMRAPQPRYSVEALSFGRAELGRSTARGAISLHLALSLSPEAVGFAHAQGASDSPSVYFALGTNYSDDDGMYAGLCALLTR